MTTETAPEPHYSKERVIRNEILIYAVGDVIPDTDPDELARQGYITKKAAKEMTAEQAEAPAEPS